jgi:uncharacterized protein YijF (DUF1287 family)
MSFARFNLLVVKTLCVLYSVPTRAETYTLAPAPLRAGPTAASAVVLSLVANETVLPDPAPAPAGWRAVRVGRWRGFVEAARLSSRSVTVFKAERVLELRDGPTVIARYPVALGAGGPAGDKQRQGDRASPEGRFFIAALDAAPAPDRYGARSLLLSYPAAPHARRGFGAGIVTRDTYARIVRQIRAGQLPDQQTALGGSIRIHGGGADADSTLGCVALSDAHVQALFDQVQRGTRVDIFASRAAFADAQALHDRILRAAEAQLARPAFYSRHAMGAPRLPYPGGDLDPDHAVCTDIAIRALRGAGIDLQSLVWEDRLLRPGAYGRGEANWSVDHRRVRNLVTFLDRWADLSPATDEALGPGDLAVFDVGVANGIPFDHVGVVGRKGAGMRHPLVINIWAPGARTSAMPLLGQEFPRVVARYRVPRQLWGW